MGRVLCTILRVIKRCKSPPIIHVNARIHENIIICIDSNISSNLLSKFIYGGLIRMFQRVDMNKDPASSFNFRYIRII